MLLTLSAFLQSRLFCSANKQCLGPGSLRLSFVKFLFSFDHAIKSLVKPTLFLPDFRHAPFTSIVILWLKTCLNFQAPFSVDCNTN